MPLWGSNAVANMHCAGENAGRDGRVFCVQSSVSSWPISMNARPNVTVASGGDDVDSDDERVALTKVAPPGGAGAGGCAEDGGGPEMFLCRIELLNRTQ